MELKTQNGFTFYIDDEDYEKVAEYHWTGVVSRHRLKNGQYGKIQNYILSDVQKNGQRFTLFLHRLLLNAPPHFWVDHRDGNGLNNHKDNLRFCTNSQNQANRGAIQLNNTSGFNGVTLSKHDKKWRAKIMFHKRRIHLGAYGSAEEAAKAYDKAAIELFGEFARVNLR